MRNAPLIIYMVSRRSTGRSYNAERQAYSIELTRLAGGAWCHRQEKTIGQGDIAAFLKRR